MATWAGGWLGQLEMLLVHLYDVEVAIVVIVERIIPRVREVENLSAFAVAGAAVVAGLLRLLLAVIELVLFLIRAVGIVHNHLVFHRVSFPMRTCAR